ncbi:MAG: outer membrane beta-barrel protein [Chitinophagaceae bacterium]|jgi:hypothetical protein|nr:outer membrane beta-barrel protein [Chitinophagaceae bacterium]
MQDMSPDMEELLRKASENYPLKQTEDRWDKIASEIIQDTAPDSGFQKTYWYKKQLILSAVLLLLFLILGDTFSGLNDSSQKFNNETKIFLPVHTKEKVDNDKILLKPERINKNYTVSFINPKPVKSSDSRILYENDFLVKPLNPTSPGINRNKDDSHTSLVHFEQPLWDIRDLNENIFPFNLKIKTADKKETNLTARKGFYFGLLAGPELNTVKSQGVKKIGLNAGVLAGYRFNKSISLETGLSLSRKFYSTSGEHFSMKEIGPAMPSAMKVMEVDGNTQIVEIPVHFRYEIFQNKKRSIYSLAGFSSLIVDQETNQYHTLLNGTEEMVYGIYKNNRAYFASSINLAIGYEQKLGTKNLIRIQPYIQLPVKGVGVGDLQVMNSGLQVGITRRAY